MKALGRSRAAKPPVSSGELCSPVARRPATARDCVSLVLVRHAHEDAAARLVPAVLTGSGGGRDGLALSESTRSVDGSPGDVVGWTGAYVPARPARRCRPPLASRLPPVTGRAKLCRALARFTREDAASHRGAPRSRASRRSRPIIPGMRALSAPPAPVPG